MPCSMTFGKVERKEVTVSPSGTTFLRTAADCRVSSASFVSCTIMFLDIRIFSVCHSVRCTPAVRKTYVSVNGNAPYLAFTH